MADKKNLKEAPGSANSRGNNDSLAMEAGDLWRRLFRQSFRKLNHGSSRSLRSAYCR